MDLISKHCEKKELLPEEKQQQTHDFEGSEQGVRIDTIDSEDDDFQYQFNFDLSVAIIEEETDEVGSEFFDSVKEIGSKSFACTHCEKICKSKGGLTRHINSKHKEARDIATSAEHNQIPLCEGTITSIIQSIKTDLLEKKYYGEEIQNGLKNVSGGEALLDALQPLYEKFCRKKNMDKLLESFYGLIPRSCELLNCNEYRVANLVMVQIPDHLASYYEINRTETTTEGISTTTSSEKRINPEERGPLSYLAGYVVSKLHKTCARSKDKNNGELLSLLQNMKSAEGLTNSFISARTRGGLVTLCDDLVGILEIAEVLFREKLNESEELLRKIPVENICISTMNSPQVKSLWENIVMSADVNQSSSTQKLLLENVIKLYLKVRSFSYAKDYITKHKIKGKQLKRKALRKDMKQSSA